MAAQLIFRRGTPPEAVYTFKHSLVQDVAYQSMLRGRRQQLHAAIARALENRFATEANAAPEIVAHHFTEAGLLDPAVDWWLKAGLAAARRSALKEAMTQLRRGLELVPRLPDTLDRDARELGLQVALGATLLASKGEAGPEIGRAYGRARDLYRRTGKTEFEPAVLWGLWHNHMNRAELPLAREVAADHLRSAKQRGNVVGEALGHRCALVVDLFAGEFASALRHLDRIRALTPPRQGCPDEILLDPWITALSRRRGPCCCRATGIAPSSAAARR